MNVYLLMPIKDFETKYRNWLQSIKLNENMVYNVLKEKCQKFKVNKSF